MKTYHKIENLRFDAAFLAAVIDGVEYKFQIAEISQRLANASLIERETFEISPSGYGIHWSLLDEDLSVDGLLRFHNKSLQVNANL